MQHVNRSNVCGDRLDSAASGASKKAAQLSQQLRFKKSLKVEIPGPMDLSFRLRF